ncbi:MAG: two component transcriptional regulator, LuxR family [Clostridiales bacterium]|jgi:DNA-binding NarL/FixJ family response regulator|nr:two component transcriptional regulator, LuxR family [Clostridiales bacterium]
MRKKNAVIRVLVVDDIISFRERFCEILSCDEKIEVVGAASTGKEAVEIALIEKPDVILMDLVMEDDNAGIEASQKINEMFADIKIIISTVLDDDETIFNAFQSGAVDYLLKNSKPEEVINAVHAAYNDQSPMRPLIAKKIRKEFKKMRSYQESIIYVLNIVRKLTQGELDILLLLCEGKSRNDIAHFRCIELSTVKTHISSLLRKFEKKNSNELVAMLRELGISDLIKQAIDK